MFKTKELAKAVRFALLGGAVATAMTSLPVLAAEGEEEVERIEVTGSRIKRTDLEGASPVTVIVAEEMRAEGNFTVADALRKSNYNSFGSFSEKSGSSAQSQSTVDLRGAGSDRTLVLIDGKRFPGSPSLGGSSANLNMIPMAAVERIEILTDGASATYGSDAVAGVVNIITKKDFEGLSFSVGAGKPKHDGGDSNEFSIVAGTSGNKGNITAAFERQQRDEIYDKDRWYTAPRYEDLDGDGIIEMYTAETTGISYVGATFFDPETFMEVPATNCAELTATVPGFVGVMGDGENAEYGYACGYAYAGVSANKASIERNSVYVNGNYEINEHVEAFGRISFVHNESFGRFAPAAVLLGVYDDYLVPVGQLGNPFDEPAPMALRFSGGGPRDNNIDDFNQDYLIGLRGNIADRFDWETYYHRNQTDSKSIGEYYFSNSGLALNFANDIPLDSEEGIANMKATTVNDDYSTFNQFFGGVGFDAIELPAGPISHYVGAEYFDQSYASIVDAQNEAGLVGGTSGGSARGERDVTALFYEGVVPIVETVEVNLAARYDDYSDVGSNVSPKAAVRWTPVDEVVVRASYGEGFRAPSMNELYAADSFSAEYARDYVSCADLSNCNERQYNTFFVSNPDLDPETSKYINLGVAWDIVDEVGVKLDAYKLTVTDVIDTVSVQDLIWAEYNGQPLDIDNVSLVRSSTGSIQVANTTYINKSEFETTGLDFTVNGKYQTSYGDFGANILVTKVLSYEEEAYYRGPVQDTAGWALQPDLKVNATFDWRFDAVSIVYNANYIDSTFENEDPELSGTTPTGKLSPSGSLSSWLIHNVQAAYDAGDYGIFSLGVNNLTDKDPVLNSDRQYASGYEDLYNNYGRVYTANYTKNF